MITRAQAEALLTLAESLEACERSGLEIVATLNSVSIFYSGKYADVTELNGMSVRLLVNQLVPKQET